MKNYNNLLITIGVVFANLFIDRITKIIALVNLKGEGIYSFLADTIRIYYEENTGAFLSMGTDWPIVMKYIILIIIPLIVCFYGIYYCAKKSNNLKVIISLSTIIGGGLGNLFDRIFYNFKVIDFLNFGIFNLRTGVLNVADLSVTIGAVLLLILSNNKASKNSIEKASIV